MIILPDPSPGTLELRTPGRFMLHVAARQRGSLIGAGVMGCAWMLSQAVIPMIVGRTVDAGVLHHNPNALLTGCLLLAGLGLISALTGVMRHRFAVSNWLQATLRTQRSIGHHVADHGLVVTSGTTTGEVVETVATDAARLGDLFDILARGSGAVCAYLVVTVLLLRMDVLVGTWVALGVPVLSATLIGVVRPLQARQKQHREREGELTALGADTVAGLRVLRGIGGEDQFLARYRDRSQQVRRAGVRVAGWQAGLDGAAVLLPGLFVVSLTWLGAHAALSGRLTPGQLVSIYGYAAFLQLPLETAAEVLSKAVLARVAVTRMIAVLGQRGSTALPAASDSAGSAGLTGSNPPIGPFPPPGATVDDVESGLSVLPGLFTAVVSAQPEDAAAIADRLALLKVPAQIPTQRSSPRLGGVPLDELPVDAVRARILVSEAEPRLFTGTLRSEIDPSGEHRDAALLAALTVADAIDVLEAAPDGLESRVEERGREFSGGQRQRLVLARAVLADPEVLVLVEPTSAVDAHTEARVAYRLRAARAGRTTLVTTVSPLILDLCDRVVLLVDGKVAAVGTHRELIRDNLAYRAVVLR